MDTIYIDTHAPGAPIRIGRRGEHKAKTVVFDLAPLETQYGTGSAQLLVQRKGDDAPYLAQTLQEGTLLRWEVTALDTAVEGIGCCELLYTVGDVLVKTQIFKTITAPGLGAPLPPPGQPGCVGCDLCRQQLAQLAQTLREIKELVQQGIKPPEEPLLDLLDRAILDTMTLS